MSHNEHSPLEVLRRYAVDPSTVDPINASSVEAHLVHCSSCRASLNDIVGRPFLESSWAAVADRVDTPRRGPFERTLASVGFTDSSARLLGATGALRAAAVAAVVLVIATAAVSAQTNRASGLFLALAPLVPLAVVAMAFATTNEPVGDLAVATPLHGLPLVVRRAAVVTVVAFASLGVVDAVAGSGGASHAAWVLPSFALVASVLAVATWVRVEVATAVLAAVWITLVWPVRLLVDGRVDVGASVAFAARGQLAALCVALVSVAVLWMRRDRFESVEVFS